MAAVTPMGQLSFFIDFLKTGGIFDPWVSDCPLHYRSPNAPEKRDVLGTVLLSILAGHHRYAHMTSVRSDNVNAELLGMTKVVSEDAVRRGFKQMDENAGATWLAEHTKRCYGPLLCLPWIMDGDTTVKPLYGKQEGAELGHNPESRQAVPHLSHIPDGQYPPYFEGGNAGRKQDCDLLQHARLVGALGSYFATLLAQLFPGRFGMGNGRLHARSR